MPFFSVIIPVYNVAPYLRECLDSVLAQTFTDWEAICVDDGSTDGSGAILDEYAAKDNRIKVIHQANTGVSAARNTALEIAVGEYVCFVDGDDVILPKWFEHFNALIVDTNCDWARLALTEWVSGTEYPNVRACCNVVWNSEREDEIVTTGLRCVLEDGYSWLNAIRRSVVGNTRFDTNLVMHEDCIFLANIVLGGKFSICVGDYAGYLYRKRGESACVIANAGDGNAYTSILLALCEFAEDHQEAIYAESMRRGVVELLGYAFMSRFECAVRLSYLASNNLLASPRFAKIRHMANKYKLANFTGIALSWKIGYWFFFRLGTTFMISLRWRIARIHCRAQKFIMRIRK